jgi:hypothetical protein
MKHGISIDRVTVNVSPEQIAWLNETARERATSASDIVRRLIDETRGAYLTPADARFGISRSDSGFSPIDNPEHS